MDELWFWRVAAALRTDAVEALGEAALVFKGVRQAGELAVQEVAGEV